MSATINKIMKQLGSSLKYSYEDEGCDIHQMRD